ncbi:MAG: tRNA (adenosine(37)-N6)-threonylcarbamoyltransferase complex dimerization subunit type 1 TsaB, partial [Anaerovoracaceae bacterium]
MYILAIETTGPQCSVALVSGDGGCRVLGMESSAEALSHLRDLVPLTEKLLSHLNVAKSALSHIAVSAGPGSFTGIRIGVTTARALGQALNLPVIAVPTLDAFAYKEAVCGTAEPVGTSDAACDANPVGTSGTEGAANPVACAILNARRGQVYGKIEGWLPGCPCMLTDVLDILKSADGPVKKAGRPVLFFGDGIDAYEGRILDELGEA